MAPQEGTARGPGDAARHARQGGDDPAQRIGFDDVADDLVGIDRVVDSDAIEPGREFLPEGPLRRGREQQQEEQARERREAEPGVAAPQQQGVRQQGPEDEEGGQQPGQRGQVEPDSEQQGLGPVAGGQGVRAGRRDEAQPGQGGDEQEGGHAQRQGGETRRGRGRSEGRSGHRGGAGREVEGIVPPGAQGLIKDRRNRPREGWIGAGGWFAP